MLNRFFEKYTGVLRSLKPVYVLNNLLNYRQLQHNRALYRRYGLRKSIFSPIGTHDFPQHHPDIPWLDRPDALEQVEKHPDFASFDADTRAQIRQFVEQGYLILTNVFSETETEALNAEVDRLLESGAAAFNYTGRKINNLFEISELANQTFYCNAHLLRLLSFLLGKKVLPFHSLNFTLGSEQRAHSDYIHMATEPQGYLIATWIALEDCTPDNGPLFFYPGSHRLPLLSTADYDSGNTWLTIGNHSNRRYEDKIETLLQDHSFEKKLFLGKRGDVLVWHANLIHGGSAIRTPGATRKSMVNHYFAEGVICYHEMSQRPAFITQHP